MAIRERIGVPALALAILLGSSPGASAQLNPFSAIARGVTTALDLRTKEEVALDVEIGTAASKRLLDDEKAEWKGVSILVFQGQLSVTGAVKDEKAKQLVEKRVREDRRIRSFANDLLVGDVGSLVRDTALEARINAALTAASGVASVNMRWNATGGQVVLIGAARSAEEKTLAEKTVRELDGVKRLRSRLRVVVAKK